MVTSSERIVARWRETGRWWVGERPQEIVIYRDNQGLRRTAQRDLPPYDPSSVQSELHENHTEDIDLRPRKLRDEKVAIACGYTPTVGPVRRHQTNYVLLHAWSGYSFGRSLLFARELPRRAAALGIPAMLLADRMSLAGALEFAHEAKACGVKPLIGTTLEMETGGHLVVIAKSRHGYVQLSRLITACHLEEPRLFPLCTWTRLARHSAHLRCLTGGDGGVLDLPLMANDTRKAQQVLDHLVHLFGRSDVFIQVERSDRPWEVMVNQRLLQIAEANRITAVAGGVVTHAEPDEFPAQDILVCAETLCEVEELIGRKPQRHPQQHPGVHLPARAINAERWIRPGPEFAARYALHPELVHNTFLVAEGIDDDVLPPRTDLPQTTDDPAAHFVQLVKEGAIRRYGQPSKKLTKRLAMEVNRILKLGFADHFVIAADMCEWANQQGIQLSGRGSVVDSVVAYCLGFSRIDAFAHDLHFDRFLPPDGSKRPDIDIDFEARRRDDVRNYLIRKYGKDHVASVAAFGAYCTRGIMREVGKALGIHPQLIGFLAKRTHRGVPADQLASALERKPELRHLQIDHQRLHWLFTLAPKLMDVPRNLRLHSSGVVISRTPVADTVPLTWSLAPGDEASDPYPLHLMQWDKRSAKYCFDKFDILCLRGQDVLSGFQERIRLRELDFDVTEVSTDDPETYRTMRAGELIGIPQSASPAMRQAHMRLKTANLQDASLVQAGIRPGVGGAVKMNELFARRNHGKPWSLPHPDFESILGHTYGIVVFQEQVDQLLQTFAGYTGGEAEDIRDAIHKRRKEDFGQTIRDELFARVQSRGYSLEVAEFVFDLVAAFKGYGFAQGHALAFAEISIRSIYCQQNYPAEYFAALLDAQPAGYYGPCTLVNEARTRGVAILPPCINRSELKFQVEDVKSPMDPQVVLPSAGIRVALSVLHGLSRTTQRRIIQQRDTGYKSLFHFCQRVKPTRPELENLILCGAFDDLHPHRRALMWAVTEALEWARADEDPLQMELNEPPLPTGLPDFTEAEKHIRERALLGLDIQHHLMAYERQRVQSKGGITTHQARELRHMQRAILVGNPIRLRFPPTPSGKRVVFFDLEDETGLLNVTAFDRVYQRDGHAIVGSPYVTVIGRAQWRDGHLAFLADRVFPYSPVISQLADRILEELPVSGGDFLVG